MLISARIIKRPRVVRICENCRQAIDGAVLRLYGSADYDPPYVVYLHPYCDTSQEVLAKLKKGGGEK